MDDSTFDGPMKAFFIVFAIFFVLVLVFIILGATRSARTLRRAGIDPLAPQASIAAKLVNSQLLQPEQTLTERLAELDRLKAAGTITDAEYDVLRAKILDS
jgi:hypothetical protein